MTDLWTTLALLLVVEGLIYAAAPNTMKRMVISILGLPSSSLRLGGLAVATVGVGLIWLIRG